MKVPVALVAACTAACLFGSALPASGSGRGGRERGSERAASAGTAPRLPVRFEENRGQSDPSVRFVARARGYTGLLTDRGIVLRLPEGAAAADRPARTGLPLPRTRVAGLSMEFVGGGARAAGAGPLPGSSSYLVGRDRSRWVKGVPAFAGAAAAGVWPGMDVRWNSEEGRLRYSIHAAPGADPGDIGLRFTGADSIRIDAGGDLLLETPFGTVRHTRPLAWQECGGVRAPVAASFDLRAAGIVGIGLGPRDPRLAVEIDPRIDYSTYLGSLYNDPINGMAADADGAVYVVGNTDSVNFPIVGGFRGQAQFALRDVFVAKFSPGGGTLLWSTFLGGSDIEYGNAIALDSGKRVWVAGSTTSSDFPAVSAYQSVKKGYYEAYAARISAAGDALELSTYLGGATSNTVETAGSAANAIAVDSADAAYVVGTTSCSDFPTKDAFQAAHGGQVYDAFVTKLTSAGALAYSSYLGGSKTDMGRAVAVDSQGRAYVAGFNGGGTFPSVNPVAGITGSGLEAFLARVAADGKSLHYSFRWGGTYDEDANAVALGPNGEVVVVGTTASTDFPVKNPAQTHHFPNSSGSAAFLTKFSGDGSQFLYSTFVGGDGTTVGYGLAVDPAGGAWVAGHTNSSTSNFPATGAVQATYGGGNSDAFVAHLNPSGSSVTFSTYLGGGGYDIAYGVALASGATWCAGATNSTNFPRKNALQSTYGGGDTEGFLTEISVTPNAPLSAAAQAVSANGIAVSWTDNSNDETGFLVQRRPPGGEFAAAGTVTTDAVSFLDSGLSPVTAYEYRVASFNADGSSAWSATVGATTFDVPPFAPVIVSAEPLSPTSVRLTWTDMSDNETSFEVLYGFPSAARTLIPALPAGTTVHDVTGLLPARTYAFTVRGRNDVGAGNAPADVLATTDATASFTLLKGTVKSSPKYRRDAASLAGTIAAGELSPDGLLDPVADGIEFHLGGERFPFTTVSIPAASPVWKERRGKFTWKSAKGFFPKSVVTFVPATGAFTLKISKVDFAGDVPPAIEDWFATGDDAGTGSADWQEARPGSWRFPAK